MKDRRSYFLSRSIFNGISISYLLLVSGTSFWISGLLGTLFGIIIIKLYNIKTYKFIKLIANISILFISFSILVNIGHSLYLRNTPIWLIALIPALGTIIMSGSKKKPLISSIHIFFIYSIFLFILAMLGLIPHVNINNMRPIFQENIGKILIGCLTFTLSGILPIISNNEIFENKKAIMRNYIIAMITVLTICFFSISVLGLREVQIYRYPEYVVLKRIKFLNFISNVDAFFNFAIITDIMFSMTLELKEIEFSTSKRIKILIMIIITLLTVWACHYNFPLLFIYKNIPWILLFLTIIQFSPQKKNKNNISL